MKTFLILGLASIVVGCAHTSGNRSGAVRASAPLSNNPSAIVPLLVEDPPVVRDLSPGDSIRYQKWEVLVSPPDGHLTVAALSDSGRETMQPAGWRAGEGSFICIENHQRLWVYDGRGDLTLFQRDPGLLGTFGPRFYPCEIPPLIVSKLPVEVYERVKPLARAN